MTRVLKRGLVGAAAFAAATSLAVVVATPAQASSVDARVRTMEDSQGDGVNVCAQFKPNPTNCVHA